MNKVIVCDALPVKKLPTHLLFWAVILELMVFGDDVSLHMDNCHVLWRSYKKHQFSSHVIIFHRKSGLLSIVLLHHYVVITFSFISILGMSVGRHDAFSDPYYEPKFWLSLQMSLPSDDDQNPQPLVSVSQYPHSIILQAIIHCVGCLPVIYNHPWTCGITQTPWTGMSFVLHIPPKSFAAFVASFHNCWWNLLACCSGWSIFPLWNLLSPGTCHAH